MKRLIIVCEGPTEQEFCRDLLAPYFLKHDICIETPTIKKSGGGITSWAPLRTQLRKHLLEGNAFVTMMIDYYGIRNGASFPGWQEAASIENKSERINFILNRISLDMDANLRSHFIPYIQLHEFEALLFSEASAFERVFSSKSCNFEMIEKVVRDFPNPELINNSPCTAPSKRLISAVPSYSKPLDGKRLAELLGLETIRIKCPLFNAWVEKLENIM